MQSESAFLTLYVVLTAIFVGFVLLLIITSDRLFQAQRNEDIKEGMRLTIKLFSFFMACFLFTLQIPMMTTYL